MGWEESSRQLVGKRSEFRSSRFSPNPHRLSSRDALSGSPRREWGSRVSQRAARSDLRNSPLPGEITGSLAHHRREPIQEVTRTRLWPRRQLHFDPFVLKQGANAEYMKGIAYRNAVAHAIRAHDVGHPRRGLRRVG